MTALRKPCMSSVRFSERLVSCRPNGGAEATRSASASVAASNWSRGDDAVDHAERERLRRAHPLAGEQELLGPAQAHHPGVDQYLDRRGRKRLADGIGEERILARHDQVAHVGDHEPTGDAGALHLRDGRLRAVPDAQAVVEIDPILVRPALLDREVGALGLRFLQVVPGGEMVAAARR